MATAAEVAGLAYWLHQLESGSQIAGFVALLAGEAVEWSLLAALIVSHAAAGSDPNGKMRSTLVKTAAIILSESLLWVCWIAVMPYTGFAIATLALLAMMHVKHAGAVSVYTGRPMSEDALDISSIAATVLEVGGAAALYQLFYAGHASAGVAVLGLCIAIEHSLQFRSAGIFNPKGTRPAFS